MQARYRYRIEPTQVQHTMLARTFGCARVAFNDAIRCREEAWRAGQRLSPSEVQRRVTVEAKTTEARAWLSEVSSVALVQSVRDADRAFANFFDSIKGRRRGRKVGKPRLKSRKDNRQSFRLTRNGFTLRADGRLYLAKIGDVRVRWSRELPSEPSSVTIIREADGRCYASFVVEVESAPLPPVESEVGIDLGIVRLATMADRSGQHKSVANPKHLAGRQRKLARLQREMARRAKVARIGQSRVSRSRYSTARCLVLAGTTITSRPSLWFARTKRSTSRTSTSSVWSATGDWLIREKAERYGRILHRVDRWLPSSKMCSACGHVLDILPLRVRYWACPVCGVAHDRDHNAAMNILAAGRAERRNACGADVGPPVGRQSVMKQEAP